MNSIFIKNSKLKIKQALKKIFDFLLKTDIDSIFVFLASFVFLDYPILNRVLFSVGLIYLYKMIMKDMFTINLMRSKK